MEPIEAVFTPPSESGGDILRQARRLFDATIIKAAALRRADRHKFAQQLWHLRSVTKDRGYLRGQHRAEIEKAKYLLCAQAQYRQLLLEADRECLAVAIRVAEEIVGQEIKAARRSVLARIRRGLKTIRDMREVQIEVHPKEFQKLKDELAALAKSLNATVIPCPEIAQGDAKITTPTGSALLSLTDHLQSIKMELETALHNKPKAMQGNL